MTEPPDVLGIDASTGEPDGYAHSSMSKNDSESSGESWVPASPSKNPVIAGEPEMVEKEGSTSGHDPAADGDKGTHDPDSLGFESTVISQASENTIPQQIGEYVIERMIGSGGMGRVYLAKHQTMQRSVAIKTLPPGQAAHAWAVERFYGEVRAAARLMHPNIATAFDAGQSGGVHFLAMEYIDGLTLTGVVEANGPMSVLDAVSAIRGAAKGLAHAHIAGIIHRDVKPSNLMRAADGSIKVVDLGLALFATPQSIAAARKDDQTPSSGKLLGTVAFMSPEQLENPEYVDARTDIYSLGATLYFLLTGRPPYEGDFLEQIRAIRHDPLPELFALRPDVDLKLENVFRRMMAKRPQERYASLVEVLADLASFETEDSSNAWIGGLAPAMLAIDQTTHRGSSTGGEVGKVMGIDLGMFFATSAIAQPAGNVEVLTPVGDQRSQHRLAIADGDPVLFGEAAAARREVQPGSVLHCVALYIGQSKVDHLIHGRRCPAEVLLAMQIRYLIEVFWRERAMPSAVAITVPSSYDQFHRRAIIQAATIAGIRSVRLVDRSMAVLQSWRHDNRASAAPSRPLSTIKTNPDNANPGSSPEQTPARREAVYGERPQVVITITGGATEVIVSRYRGARIQQLASIGQWNHGTLQWQQKLVDMVAENCLSTYGFDPRQTLQSATQLQLACERALPKFVLLDHVNIAFQHGNKAVAVAVPRSDWLQICKPLWDEVLQMIDAAVESAGIKPERVSHCFLLGLIARISDVRQSFQKRFGHDTQYCVVERSDVARGAALCVAGELPGRGDIPLPPQPSTTHDFALLVVDQKNRRRIRPIIPRGTALPARTNRRITAGGPSTQVLAVVESSTWRETSWRSLGNHRFDVSSDDLSIELTFEVDVDGLLAIRRRNPNSGGFQKLPNVPAATLTAEETQRWAEWLNEKMPLPKRRDVDVS